MAELAVTLDPGGWVADRAVDAVQTAAGPVLQSAASALWRWLAEACTDIGREVVGALSAPAGVSLTSGWWGGPRTRELMGVVLAIAASLTVAFVLLAVLQGLVTGDPGGMLRSVLGQVPLSVLGVVAVAGVADLLLRVTDVVSAAVLAGTPADLGVLVERYGATATLATGGLAAVVLLVVFLVGALLVWAELVVRAALVYLLVAFAPLALAARVWPATRGMFRRLCELGVALVVSKFAIALALALGATALTGGGTTTAPDGAGLSLAGMLGGATLMGLAAFTPFVVLRLLPVVETAVTAHGISRSPVKGAQAAVAASAYPTRVARLAGGRAAGAAPTLPAAPMSATAAAATASSSPAPSPNRLAGAGPGPGRRPPAPSPVGGRPPSRPQRPPKGASS